MIMRSILLGLLTLGLSGCELAGNIFQAGFVAGLVVVIVVLGVIGWLIRRFRRSS